MKTYAYGFPRIGKNREYKRLIEAFWKGKLDNESLISGINRLQQEIIEKYGNHVDYFPIGEMTLYDNMLDTALMLGLYRAENLNDYFSLCRGKDALEMTKWFNTNYHYLVPGLDSVKDKGFRLAWNKPLEYWNKYKRGIPYMIGPFTFLKLSKGLDRSDFRERFLSLASIYGEIAANFNRVHIDEPAFVMELSDDEVTWIGEAYGDIGTKAKVQLFTYYDEVDFLERLCELPLDAVGLDFVHGNGRMKEKILSDGFPDRITLIAGVIDGRNVWKADMGRVSGLLEQLSGRVKNLAISNAAPLYHLPVTVKSEEGNLEEQILSKLSFAEEKLAEIEELSGTTGGADKGKKEVDRPDAGVSLTDSDFIRSVSYGERRIIQDKRLKLPVFPSTTIGSYPQTAEVRKKRADFKRGRISGDEYFEYIRLKIRDVIKLQEELGFDILVHGEFERSDMVEFFAEKLNGIATTGMGWIISYGTRCYRPPIIYGYVSRKQDMTVREISYAQSLTEKPVKGMLTGPVTILAWSFIRDDVPVSKVAYQIAQALRDEVRALEAAGIKLIQIDEPAFRERAPIKRRDWEKYFDWAVKAFNLTANAKAETQIHTHMCYSEFGEIIEYIKKMDFDVISIEATRSGGDIVESFEGAGFDRQIGLGVWDIHSPAVPEMEDMLQIVKRALKVIPKENFWINPDCGLKTRGWDETIASLKKLVELVKYLREKLI